MYRPAKSNCDHFTFAPKYKSLVIYFPLFWFWSQFGNCQVKKSWFCWLLVQNLESKHQKLPAKWACDSGKSKMKFHTTTLVRYCLCQILYIIPNGLWDNLQQVELILEKFWIGFVSLFKWHVRARSQLALYTVNV